MPTHYIHESMRASRTVRMSDHQRDRKRSAQAKSLAKERRAQRKLKRGEAI